MGGVGFAGGVDSHQDPFPLRLPLENRLVVGEDQFLEVPEAEGAALPVGTGHGGDPVRQAVPLRSLKGGAEALTGLDASVESHVMALAAEVSRLDGGRTITLADF